MSGKRFSGLHPMFGLFLALGCGADPVGLPAGGGGTGGAPGVGGAPGAAGQVGAAGVMTNGGSASGGGGPTGAGGTTSGVGGSGGSAGASPAGGGGAGGSGGVGAGGSAGASGTAGTGGAGNDGWVEIFNGTDLTGWKPLITGYAYGTDPFDTFTVVNGVIKVSYDKYPPSNPGGSDHAFGPRFGLLYYDKLLTNYRVRVEYRFSDPQAAQPPGWGHYNSGLMAFSEDPSKVTGNPSFPPLIEIQLLGAGNSAGFNTNDNICMNGGTVAQMVNGAPYKGGNNCVASSAPLAATAKVGVWMATEAEIHGTADSKVYAQLCDGDMSACPPSADLTTPVSTFSQVVYKNMPVVNGYMSIQSESQPCEFRKIELKELP